jgi:hypothetical protein
MRYASLLPPLIIALTVTACARQQPAYYVTDARTGQRIATGQQGASQDNRGLMGGGEAQASGYNSYASAAPQQQDDSGRGLFNSHVFRSNWFSRQSSAPTYAVQPQAPQTYAARTYPSPASASPTHAPPASASRTYAPQTYSYRPPQQQAYVQPPAAPQYRPPQPAPQQYYRPPQPQPTGYYAPQYRLY